MADVRDLERQCKALGQRRRIRIIAFLKHRRGAMAGEIAKHVQCSKQTASQHLRVLREARIVLDRKRGLNVLYVLSPHMGEMARTLLRMV